MSDTQKNLLATILGIIFVALFALISLKLANLPLLQHAGISSLIIAIICGIIYGNTLRRYQPATWNSGIKFSAKRILRIAIIFYGFRVTFQQIAAVGIEGLILDIFVVSSTLILGSWVGVKLFKLDRNLAILISAGSAICGAAAVLAIEDVLKSESYKAAVAVGTVVVFGTIAMLLYPALQHAGVFGFTNLQYGIYAGASVHEVAQALVAGSSVSANAGNIAVIVKMTRVLLLVPVLIILSFYVNKMFNRDQQSSASITIPWFALGFAAMIGINSLHVLPTVLVQNLNLIDGFLLTMAMAAIGMETNLKTIKQVGLKPLYFAICLFAWLMLATWLAIKFWYIV